jgi:hypothetical protein
MPDVSRFSHASTTGLTLEIGVGVEIWSLTRKAVGGEFPIGGLVLEAFPGASGLSDDGEYFESPASYVVFDNRAPKGHEWHRITEDDVDKSRLEVASNIGRVYRRLAYDLGKPTLRGGGWSNLVSGQQLSLGRYIGALAKVLGAGMEAVAVERPARRRDESEDW